MAVIERERDKNQRERDAEKRVKLQSKHQHAEYGRGQHGTGDEEETCDVVAVFHDSRHDETAHSLQNKTKQCVNSLVSCLEIT